jgi:two-component system chemotaxis sensor kinase CheA
VVIEVRDDGRGIDPEHVRQQAVKRGIIKAEEAARLTDQEAVNLIFESGFSTASEITEVSGRGVGMDVVRSVLDKLKGTVHISTQKVRGTTFQLRAPLTLASIQTLLFRVGGAYLPFRFRPSLKSRINDQRSIAWISEVLRLRDQIYLSVPRAFELPSRNRASPKEETLCHCNGSAEDLWPPCGQHGRRRTGHQSASSDIVSSDL